MEGQHRLEGEAHAHITHTHAHITHTHTLTSSNADTPLRVRCR